MFASSVFGRGKAVLGKCSHSPGRYRGSSLGRAVSQRVCVCVSSAGTRGEEAECGLHR